MRDLRKWAEDNFGSLDLGDARRNQRALEIGEALAASSGKSLPKSMGKWSALVAAYRLFSCGEATMGAILEPHLLRTREEIGCGRGDHLLIEDTTELDFTGHPGVTGLGRTGDGRGRGAYLHCTLGLRILGGSGAKPDTEVLGLADVREWVRTGPTRHGHETRTQRNKRAKETDRWGRSTLLAERPLEGRLIYVADRESDNYEVLADRLPEGIDFVLRANQARKTSSGGTVFEAVRAGKTQGSLPVELDSRGGRSARTATLQILSAAVRILPPMRIPARQKRPLDINVVEAHEVGAPPGAEPLRWVLLTSLPVSTREQCEHIIGIYRQRWQIEEFFKCLKSGTKAEESQLRSWEALSALVAFLLVIAVRLLCLKKDARHDAWPKDAELPDERLIAYLRHKTGSPNPAASPRNFLRAIAMLGGFIGRKSDGDPGWLLIWRGTLESLAFLNALDFLQRESPA